MVFQQFNLFPHLTALDNITLAQRVVRKRKADEAAATACELLETVGIPEKADSLSGAALRRAATAGGDRAGPGDESQDHAVRRADQRARSRDDQRSAGCDDGTGAEWHDDGGGDARDGVRAHAAAQRIIFMDEGKVIEDTTPEALFAAPKHERTKLFLSKILEH